ncbi:glutamine amidotransferase, partial [Xanthomonas citri pv. citri]|nr:glutamine amidotransferase [Xanthomonas citri pv. citri]
AVESGWGNGNRRDEGAVQGRVIGTYPHGPVLVRNPQLADHVLEMALGRRLEPLDIPEMTALRQRRIEAVRTDRS